MKILFIGDIVGKPGRQAVKDLLPGLKSEYQMDIVIANGENAAGGRGLTKEVAYELFDNGIDFITMGNHTWDQKTIIDFIDSENKLIRPANYPKGVPGKGYGYILKNNHKIGVINLAGRVFLPPLENPFGMAGQIINTMLAEGIKVIITDFHAEATSEKVAMGWFLDGKVSAVLGTHTHIQTADARILNKGTAYITDIGMTGPRDSVLGVKKEIIINNFITQMPVKFEVASGVYQLNAVLLEINEQNGRADKIMPIQQFGG